MLLGFALSRLYTRLSARGERPQGDAASNVIDFVPQLVWISSASGSYEFLSRRWQEYTGINFQKTPGHDWHEVIHPEDLPGWRVELVRMIQEGQSCEFRCRIRDKHGLFRWFLVKSNPQRDSSGAVLRWFGSCTDIHDLIASDSELKLSRDRLQLALSAGRMAAWETDLKTGEVSRTESHDQIYGYDQRQARWTFHDFISAIHEDDRERVMGRISTSTSSDGLFSDEFRIVWPDGSIHWLASRAQYQFGVDGEVVSVRGVVIDISSLKEAEEMLAIAKSSAEDASRAKSQFLANVSHELRTPLGAILGFQRMLRDPGLSIDERRQYLEIIERNGTALMQLIDDLLDHSRLEAKSLPIERIEFGLPELIDDVLHLGGLKAEEKAVLLRLTRQGDVPERIVSDPTRMRQILSNLVVNAVKFTERGEISVEVSFDNGRLRFDIRDSGIGISEEDKPDLFTPFQQGDASTTRRFGGTGLGLALSRDLARAMGGEVELVESVAGQGAWFRFVLPIELAVVSKTYSKTKSTSQADRLEGLKILIVDDSADNQLLMRRMLARAGAETATASNGREAIDAALADKFDFVLMDMQMPVLDGLTATKLLREGGYRRPIIALTAHALFAERQKCLAAGCDDHVSKPVDFRRLTDLLSSISIEQRLDP